MFTNLKFFDMYREAAKKYYPSDPVGVFGLNGWHIDNEIVETGRMVVVRATLTIPKYSIAIEQFGGNDNPDRGDAYKGACTDALSKCASYLGIGMDVYKGLHDERTRDGSGAHQNGSRSTASQPAPRPGLNCAFIRTGADRCSLRLRSFRNSTC